MGNLDSIRVAIIDYELGNTGSVRNALDSLGAQVCIAKEPDKLEAADCLILPGVGAFGDGMDHLRRFGLVPVLDELVLGQKKNILGICLGMQLMARRGFEHGEYQGLGWLDADVIGMDSARLNLKVPHVGWNDVTASRDGVLLGGAGCRNSFYFVHGYHMVCNQAEDVAGVCNYGEDFTALVERGNIFGTQFHPEKSQKAGLKLLQSFLSFSCQGLRLCNA